MQNLENDVSINLRVSKELHKIILDAAKREERSITALIRIIVRQALTDPKRGKSLCKQCS